MASISLPASEPTVPLKSADVSPLKAEKGNLLLQGLQEGVDNKEFVDLIALVRKFKERGIEELINSYIKESTVDTTTALIQGLGKFVHFTEGQQDSGYEDCNKNEVFLLLDEAYGNILRAAVSGGSSDPEGASSVDSEKVKESLRKIVEIFHVLGLVARTLDSKDVETENYGRTKNWMAEYRNGVRGSVNRVLS